MNVPLSTFLPDISVEVAGCPQPVIEHHLRRVLSDFCQQTRLLVETLPAIDIVAAQSTYAVAPSAPTKDQLVRIEEVWLDGDRLDPVSVEKLDAEMPEWRTETGTPRIYTTEGVGDSVILVPTPDANAADALVVKISIAPRVSTDVTECDEILFNQFGVGLAAGAKSSLMLLPKQAWSDPNLSAIHQNTYRTTLALGRNLARKGRTRSRQRTRSYYR